MAKIVYVCIRDIAKNPIVKNKVSAAVQKLVPDNIADAPCRLYDNGNIIYGISNYSKSIEEKEGSVCMGVAYAPTEDWCQPNSSRPDGTYAIFRQNDDCVEIVADAVASRSIWYYIDDNLFISGTSQRAVINVAGKFSFDNRVIPWILSNGTLGPSFTWCKNLKVVKAGGSVILNRKEWTLKAKAGHFEYIEKPMTDENHRQRMRQTMIDSFKSFNLDLSKWTLPISGGRDSRGILCLLKQSGKDISKLKAITWGVKAALKDKSSDAYIGKQVADSQSLQHTYYETDHIKASVEEVFDRYIQCSEGRVDHIPGYLDGFALWKAIYESGSYGILRGDETFGWHNPVSEHNSRLLNNLSLCSDYSNLEDFESYGYEKQVIPDYLKRRENESINAWADRLYEEFTIPVQMSALNDLKLSYTEIINPLLAKQIMDCTNSLPDKLRADKKLFKEVVDRFLPDIKFATKQATAREENFFASPEAVKLMTAELSKPYMKDIFPEPLLKKVIASLNSDKAKTKDRITMHVKERIKKFVPYFIKEKLRSSIPKPSLDNGILAFRIYMAGKTYRMLTDDIKQNETVKSLTAA